MGSDGDPRMGRRSARDAVRRRVRGRRQCQRARRCRRCSGTDRRHHQRPSRSRPGGRRSVWRRCERSVLEWSSAPRCRGRRRRVRARRRRRRLAAVSACEPGLLGHCAAARSRPPRDDHGYLDAGSRPGVAGRQLWSALPRRARGWSLVLDDRGRAARRPVPDRRRFGRCAGIARNLGRA
jgi:hypothetical protein